MAYADEFGGYHEEPAGPAPWLMSAAIAGGLAVTVGLTLLLLRTEAALQPVMLLGAVLAIAAIAWLILWATLLRRASAAWSVAAFALVAPPALAIGIGSLVWEGMKAEQDAKATATIAAAAADVRDPRVSTTLPPAKGPMSSLLRRALIDLLANQRDYARAVDASGIGDLNSFATLTRKGSVIENCGRLGQLAKTFEASKKRHASITAEAKRAPELATMQVAMRRQFLASMEQTLSRGSAYAQQVSGYELDAIEAAEDACEVLAHRRWLLEGDRIMFTSAADLSRFQHAVRAMQIAGAEQERLVEQQRAQLRTMGEGMIRGTLAPR
ncbi:hypothetical protein NX02_10400 [Sphingomonas sanxanigenens DSM 19645 = NX02]|uniref:Uncharacterized protein n=2 Tax=Sphingomonas sanxanigenens TaxID=397260 RepID=W0ABC4_9SPHN|nr:hypothetical protein NX02_10400 [Sphingomonas sanxanigenens DSM 19645 = NX02]